MMTTWDAKTYAQFLDLRTRPARDLLAIIPHSFQPTLIYDLGCGPGNSTILLKDRWPKAKIIGLDSSSSMLKEARIAYPNIHFIQGDISHFSPEEKIDFLFANASLQWLNKHDVLIPKLLNLISRYGIFALQMPNNFHLATHQVSIKLLQSRTHWHHFTKKLIYGPLVEPLYDLAWYYDIFVREGIQSLQMWETKYFQELSHHQEIFDWVKGSSLSSVLNTMPMNEQIYFEKAYIETISKEYPKQHNGKILLPFTRIFIVAFK